MSAISVRIPDDLAERLEELSAHTGRTKTFYILQALNDSIDDLEDAYLALNRLAEYRRDGSKSVSLGAVMAENGMAD